MSTFVLCVDCVRYRAYYRSSVSLP